MGSLCSNEGEVEVGHTELKKKKTKPSFKPEMVEQDELYSEFSGSDWEDSDFGDVDTKPSFHRRGYKKNMFKQDVYEWIEDNLESKEALKRFKKLGPFMIKTRDNGAKRNNFGYKAQKQLDYFGEIQGSKRSGRNGTDLYEGFLKNNKPDGRGRLIYNNGDIYQGDFENGNYCGYGKKVSKKYFRQGEFNEGKLNGNALEISKISPKDKYYGEFSNDKKHGTGEMYFENGDVYKGGFKNNKFHGQGTMNFKNGDTYTGNFERGMRHGYGRYSFKSGKLYAGNFKDNMFHGEGTLTKKDGNTYEGMFRNGKKTRSRLSYRQKE